MSHPHFQVVLFRPLIPQNTGNIGRLCVGFRTKLLILGEPGFSLDEKERRRAGLDYWQHLDWQHLEDENAWKIPSRCFAISKFSEKSLFDESFEAGDSFLFGQETTGLPEKYHQEVTSLRIPMNFQIRAYNLANSVAMVLSEATRQVYGSQFGMNLP